MEEMGLIVSDVGSQDLSVECVASEYVDLSEDLSGENEIFSNYYLKTFVHA
jgi:hypothetical protein